MVETSLRLTCSYRGKRVKVEGTERVAMIAPPSDDLSDEERVGVRLDLRARHGQILYTQVIRDPLASDRETATTRSSRRIAARCSRSVAGPLRTAHRSSSGTGPAARTSSGGSRMPHQHGQRCAARTVGLRRWLEPPLGLGIPAVVRTGWRTSPAAESPSNRVISRWG